MRVAKALSLRTVRLLVPPIEPAVGKLQRLGVLNNTYVIFTSDNGYVRIYAKQATETAFSVLCPVLQAPRAGCPKPLPQLCA